MSVMNGVLILWIGKFMYMPCVFYVFSNVDTVGGLYQFQLKGKKRIRGQLRSIYPLYSSWGAEKD